MKYLYIDTSSSYLYTSIVENDKVISEIREEDGQTLSKVALPRIVSMFEENNLKPIDIDRIIVVNGPGSFTGIRIGLTIAKIYAWSLDIPITTILSLEAMAVSSNKDKVHVPIIDARRGYVFTAIYDAT
jgi:tRNA threonylcarbamoyladenosine biosynthesis protein TsaB